MSALRSVTVPPLARIADITIAAEAWELVTLKAIANGLQHRTRANYRFITSFNSMLVVLAPWAFCRLRPLRCCTMPPPWASA